jgi:CDP-4-dehydro-6-deoxyglucose reductase, E3
LARARRAELLQAWKLSGSVRGLRFRLVDGGSVGHVAGQHLDIVVPTAGGLAQRRAYSIASAPDRAHPDVFEIAVTRVEGGPASEALHALQPGAFVEVEGPRGTFVRPDEDRAHPALFVAAGTGLAPIRAMLAEDVLRANGPPLVLLFGCRTPGDVLWADDLRRWQRECPRFRVHVTLSRAKGEWTGLAGYVQRHAVALARSLSGARAYVCGLSAMVDEVVALLENEAGVPRASLRYEIYD